MTHYESNSLMLFILNKVFVHGYGTPYKIGVDGQRLTTGLTLQAGIKINFFVF